MDNCGFMDELKQLLKSFLGIVMVVAVSFLIGARYGHRKAGIDPESHVIRDTVQFTIHDTITREKPVFKYSYIHDTVRAYFTTIERDTVLVDVPIEHKVYQEDSLYRCEISGYRPQLESLTIYPTITTITIREKVKTPPPKLSLGITAGPSALVTPGGKIHGGIGATVGLQYRF